MRGVISVKGVLFRNAKEVSVEELPNPKPERDEALIKVKYAGICGTDIHVYRGEHPTAKYPLVPGHEFVGQLVEMNTDKETDLKAGDYVLVQPIKSCGVCDLCIQGRDNVCSKLTILGVHDFGCFAEYIKVPARKVYRLPDGVDLRLAALTEPLAVAVHDVRASNLKVGQTVLVIGGGPIGVLIAMVAKLNGASKIVITEVNKYRIKFAEDLGFTVINPTEDGLLPKLLDQTDGKGFDIVYEVSGTRPGAELMTQAAKIGGTILIVGVASDKYPVDVGSIMAKELEIKGVRIHSQINFAAAIEILKSGVMNDMLVKLITHEFPLDRAEEAIKFSIEDQEHFKVLIKI